MQTTEMVFTRPGEPESLARRTRELGAVEPGYARIRVEATGVSAAEQAMRRGKYYQQPPFPLVPGYDLVGIVEELGTPDDRVPVGTRVAALTKTGGWASQVLRPAAGLVPVHDPLTAAEAETVITNGLTALRVLRRIDAPAGATIVVLGATGGVGSILVQLALHAGLRVIGVASTVQQQRLREHGVIPVDYRRDDVAGRVRELAPHGVAGVVDHIGGPGIAGSWRMLAPRGVLVSLSDAGVLHAAHPLTYFMRHYLRLQLWNLLPNRRRAHFFDLWAGRKNTEAFHHDLHRDLTELFGLLAAGTLTSPIDSTYSLADAGIALRRAENGGIAGKIILAP
ncbi:zinc-binding dehydrogenase [Amycolatopsis sp. PS_44_ISF1]|uniref:zinc-binding dehydrogenase n=1 Tax=Amycolatopsis sp. PS_44_ISF1 TaxID=2974917 RepID=UPI0028DD5CF7|nr:zinc-binding dehydrogenase [Amycolatopsis sp. PS_44_ISF1]MDT8913484.1 zinc-binding dehydrogenase [Amycolatopsis sp. PS_44_ISF1]